MRDHCNDATVKGGTYYPVTVKNNCGRRNRSTKQLTVYLSGRQRRQSPNQDGIFADEHFGARYRQANMSAGDPQIAW